MKFYSSMDIVMLNNLPVAQPERQTETDQEIETQNWQSGEQRGWRNFRNDDSIFSTHERVQGVKREEKQRHPKTLMPATVGQKKQNIISKHQFDELETEIILEYCECSK